MYTAGLPDLNTLKGKRLILYSGWAERQWNQSNFYKENPFISEETAEFLATCGIAALGVDCGVDRGEPYPVHKIMLGAGSAALAILLAGLMIYGLQPGPILFEQNGSFVWTIIASMFIGNIMLLVLNLPLVALWAKLTLIPFGVMPWG